jgi:predicted RNase H-like HicB family nuclease
MKNYYLNMKGKKKKELRLPVLVEKDEDDFYVVECPILPGCYSQGKTLDEALKNIHDVIELCLEETKTKELVKTYKPKEFSFHTIAVGV